MQTDGNYVNAAYKTAAERGMVAPFKFAHAAVKTSRYADMIEWYKTLLNAEVMFHSPFVCCLTYDEEHHRIAIFNRPQLKDPAPDLAGLDHLSFTYAGIDELMDTYYRLKAGGMSPFWTILHGPTLSMYFRNPDQGQVELQIDVFETMDELMKWFESGAYDENPVGIKVDIEELFERYKAGTPLRELLSRRSLRPGESFMEHIVE